MGHTARHTARVNPGLGFYDAAMRLCVVYIVELRSCDVGRSHGFTRATGHTAVHTARHTARVNPGLAVYDAAMRLFIVYIVELRSYDVGRSNGFTRATHILICTVFIIQLRHVEVGVIVGTRR